jgi:prolipoprotein diacylglyceryltransferase
MFLIAIGHLKNASIIHYFFEMMAFFVGIRVYYFLKKQQPDFISSTNRLFILLGAMIGALIGSRFFAFLETPSMLKNLSWLAIYQSKTVAGGFLGGLFGVEITKKIVGVVQASGDLYVFPIVIALFIGRIGCFLMGIQEPTFGIETTFFTGMNLGDGLNRHPVVLYEMIFLFFIFLLFMGLKNKSLINGDRFKMFMVLYFGFRFWMEFLKPFQPIFLNISIIHWMGLFIFVYYFKFIFRMLSAIKN